MNLTEKRTIQNILAKYNLRPSKRLGQNFLVSRNALSKVIAAADLSPQDTVLEIGPGIGTLTAELAKRAKKVIAVEKDQKMCEILKDVLQDFDNIEIIQGDILTLAAPGEFFNGKPSRPLAGHSFPKIPVQIQAVEFEPLVANYKVVANLPYYITSPVIRKFLEIGNPPKLMILMVQKEVAQRITAKPPDMSILSVSVQFYAEPKIISYAQKTAFWPQPKVDSAIIKISNIKNPMPTGRQENSKIQLKNKNLFFTIVKAGFSHPRKQIIGNLSGGLKLERTITEKWLGESGIKPEQRAETLNIRDWIFLTKNYPQA